MTVRSLYGAAGPLGPSIFREPMGEVIETDPRLRREMEKEDFGSRENQPDAADETPPDVGLDESATEETDESEPPSEQDPDSEFAPLE